MNNNIYPDIFFGIWIKYYRHTCDYTNTFKEYSSEKIFTTTFLKNSWCIYGNVVVAFVSNLAHITDTKCGSLSLISHAQNYCLIKLLLLWFALYTFNPQLLPSFFIASLFSFFRNNVDGKCRGIAWRIFYAQIIFHLN